ncbi:hypothetical protein MAPG_08257 [Magnaporthiopsis poae ATCC 64411]|uniref:Uncharacterized protein n=1 Tax=Magnaporthiopsis poae (strain ATCC 64411 / 73-15) TaxID=644358 RepID=A0A0C4E6W0_MAGP6|nr:hypothetical protein MAPG_08257 [Magnaporthiopsis poae ATCC 64411]
MSAKQPHANCFIREKQHTLRDMRHGYSRPEPGSIVNGQQTPDLDSGDSLTHEQGAAAFAAAVGGEQVGEGIHSGAVNISDNNAQDHIHADDNQGRNEGDGMKDRQLSHLLVTAPQSVTDTINVDVSWMMVPRNPEKESSIAGVFTRPVVRVPTEAADGRQRSAGRRHEARKHSSSNDSHPCPGYGRSLSDRTVNRRRRPPTRSGASQRTLLLTSTELNPLSTPAVPASPRLAVAMGLPGRPHRGPRRMVIASCRLLWQ